MALYTKNDEFDAETRVQFTNEIPPYDLLKGAHSFLQQYDEWRYFLGEINVFYDMPSFDKAYAMNSNIDISDFYHKSVNGSVSQVYGPQRRVIMDNGIPTQEIKDDSEYRTLEVNGVLAPEEDLFLHEIYRYLDTVYPNHPDWLNLLTENEINDAFLAAGAVVDYVPDIKFFNYIIESISEEMSSSEISSEKFKLVYRNLLNNSFRRKFYGTYLGYKMFYNDFMYTCGVYPVATQLPIKPVRVYLSGKNNEKVTEDNISSITSTNLHQIYPDKTIKNRFIDTYDSNYYHKFRLIDWNGKNTISEEVDDTNKNRIIGLPDVYSTKRIYEWKYSKNGSTGLLDEIKELSVLESSDGTYSTINSKGSFVPYETTIENGAVKSSISTSLRINYADLDRDVAPSTMRVNLIKLKTIDEVKDIIDEKELMKQSLTSGSDLKGLCSEDNICFESNNTTLDLFIDPMYAGAFALTPEKAAGTYKESIDLCGLLTGTGLPYADQDFDYTVKDQETTNVKYKIPGIHFLTNTVHKDDDSNEEQEIKNLNESEKNAMNLLIPTTSETSCVRPGDIISTNLDFGASPTEEIAPPYAASITSIETGTIKIANAPIPGELGAKNDLSPLAIYGIVVINNRDEEVVLLGNLIGDSFGVVEADSSSYEPQFLAQTFKIKAIPKEIPDGIKYFLSDKTNTKNNYERLYSDDEKQYTITNGSIVSQIFVVDPTICQEIQVLPEVNGDAIEETQQNGSWSFISTVHDMVHKGEESYVGQAVIESYLCSDIDLLTLKDKLSGIEFPETYECFALNKNKPKYDVKEVLSSPSDGMVYNSPLIFYTFDEKNHTFSQVNYTCTWETVDGNTVVKDFDFGDLPEKTDLYIFTKKKVGYKSDQRLGRGKITDVCVGRLLTVPVLERGTPVLLPSIDTRNPQTFEWYRRQGTQQYAITINKVYADNKTSLFGESFIDHLCYLYDNESDVRLYDREGKPIVLNELTSYYHEVIKYSPVKIVSTVSVSPSEQSTNIISFENEDSRKLAKTLSIGDIVTGPGLSSKNIAYITSIGENSIEISTSTSLEGEFEFTYMCRLKTIPTDHSEDFQNYKLLMRSRGTLDQTSESISNFIWPSPEWPNSVCKTPLTGLLQVEDFAPWSSMDGKYSRFTHLVMPTVYADKQSLLGRSEDGALIYDNILIPSTIKYYGDVYIDINADKLLSKETKKGSTPCLMTHEILDYAHNNLKEITRAGDNVSVGVNVTMETDTSGYLSLVDHLYTDRDAKIKFQTINWDINTVPVRAALGNGDVSDRVFKSLSDAPVSNQLWNSLGVYDHGAGQSENKHPTLWNSETNVTDRTHDDIGNALLSTTISEYDIQMHYTDLNLSPCNGRPSEKSDITTVQLTFGKQSVDTNTITNVKIFPASVTDSLILGSFSDSEIELLNYVEGSYEIDTVESTDKTTGETVNVYDISTAKPSGNYNVSASPSSYKYLGDFTPILDNGTINFPDINKMAEDFEDGIIDYYVIRKESFFEDVRLGPSCDVDFRTSSPYSSSAEDKAAANDIFTRLTKDVQCSVSFGENSILCVSPDVNGTYRWSCKKISSFGVYGHLTGHGISAVYTTLPSSDLTFENSLMLKLFGNYTSFVSADSYSIDASNRNNFNRYVEALEDYNNTTNTSLDKFFNKLWYCELVTPSITEDHGSTPSLGTASLANLYAALTAIRKEENSEFTYIGLLPMYSFREKKLSVKPFYINANKLIMSTVDISSKYMISDEYSFLISPDSYWRTYRDIVSTEIKLPHGKIANGSYKFNLVVNPDYSGEVYPYDDYLKYLRGEITSSDLHAETVNITESPILYNSEYDFFFIKKQELDDEYLEDGVITPSSNTVNIKRYVIKFIENNYFKNSCFITGTYQAVKSQSESSISISKTPTFKPFTYVENDIGYVSKEDRVLKIDLVSLRNAYSPAAAPVYFSSYDTITGQVKIGDLDETNKTITLSYDQAAAELLSEDLDSSRLRYQVNFLTQINTLKPIKILEDGTTSVLSTDEINFYDGVAHVDSSYGDNGNLYAPHLADFYLSKGLNLGTGKDFKYFKNNLLVEADFDASKPTLVTSSDPLFADAMRVVKTGDTLVEISTISGGSTTTKTLSLSYIEDDIKKQLSPECVAYVNGYLFASYQAKVFYKKIDISNASEVVFDESLILSGIGGSSENIRVRDISYIEKSDVADIAVETYGYVFTCDDKLSTDDITRVISTTDLEHFDVEAIAVSGTLYTSSTGLTKDQVIEKYNENKERQIQISIDGVSFENLDVSKLNDTDTYTIKLPSDGVSDIATDEVQPNTFFYDYTGDNGKEFISCKGEDILHTAIVEEYHGQGETPDVEKVVKYHVETNKSMSIGKMIYASSNSGYAAKLVGSDLYLKSPVAIYENGEYTFDISRGMHWKKVTLPKTFNSARLRMSTLSDRDFYLSLEYALTQWRENLSNGSTTQKALNNAVTDTLLANAGFLKGSDNHILTLDEFIESCENGKSYTLKISFIDGVADFSGTTVYTPWFTSNVAGIERVDENFMQTYRSMMADVMEYVFGQLPTESMFNQTNADSLKFTDFGLQIIMHGGDIFTLPYKYMTKASDIRDPQNWSVPSYPEGSVLLTEGAPQEDKITIKIGGKTYKSSQVGQTSLTKLFTISGSYEDDKCSVFVGAKAGAGAVRSVFKDNFPNEQATEKVTANKLILMNHIMANATPYILYSTDGGSTMIPLVIPPSLRTEYDFSRIQLTPDGYTGAYSKSDEGYMVPKDTASGTSDKILTADGKYKFIDTIIKPTASGAEGFGSSVAAVACACILANGDLHILIAYEKNGKAMLSPWSIKVANENGMYNFEEPEAEDLTTLFGDYGNCETMSNETFFNIVESLGVGIPSEFGESKNGTSEMTSVRADDVTPFNNLRTNTDPSLTPLEANGNIQRSGGDKIFVTLPATVDWTFTGEPSIQSASTDGITFDVPLATKSMISSTVKVLMSIRTTAQVSNPIEFLNSDKADRYMSDVFIGELKVKHVEEVESATVADMMFNDNQIKYLDAKIDPNSDYVFEGGYPSTYDDRYDHVLYDCDTDINRTPFNLTNGEGNIVVLCDETGNPISKFISDTQGKAHRRVNIIDRLVSQSYENEYIEAPKPLYKGIVQAMESPNTRVRLSNSLSDILKDCEVVKALYTTTSPDKPDNRPELVLKVGDSSFAKIKALAESQKDSNIYVSLVLSVPYEHNSKAMTLKLRSFNLTDGIVNNYGNIIPNKVYLPITGYGSLLGVNHDWTRKTPWDCDMAAFSQDPSDIVKNSIGDVVYLCDENGLDLFANGERIPLRKPVYDDQYTLISELGYTVLEEINNSIVHNAEIYSGEVASIDDNYTVVFKDLLDTNGVDLNDGNQHTLRIELLTRESVPLKIKHANDPRYFVQVTRELAKDFGFDRIYFPADGYPSSPAIINNEVYNAENNDKYSATPYTSKTGTDVYLCDENGILVTYTTNNGILGTRNLSEDITSETSLLIQPYTPLYESCQDWYKEEYYVSGEKSNPYWQVINFVPKYDKVNQTFTQDVKYMKYSKISGKQTLVECSPEEVYFNISKVPELTDYGTEIDLTAEADFLDLSEGKIKFVMSENTSSKWYQSTVNNFVHYGVSVVNSKHPDETKLINGYNIDSFAAPSKESLFEDNHNGNISNIYFSCTYDSNTYESYISPEDTESAIVEVTELGLFDKRNKLVAYAKFPPIEYRTDKQHVDFTLLISHTNLTREAER